MNRDVLGIGHFVLGDDARVEFRYACDVEGGLLGTAMVTNPLRCGLWYGDRVFAGLMATTFGRTTAPVALTMIQELL